MAKEQDKEQPELAEGYTAAQAAAILSKNSGRTIPAQYLSQLARAKAVRSVLVSKKLRLYNKEDINNYVVEDRGKKSGQAQAARFQKEYAEGYTAEQAAAILSKNSGRRVDGQYVRQLVRQNAVRSTLINKRLRLYNKEDINSHVVRGQGQKSGRSTPDRGESEQAA